MTGYNDRHEKAGLARIGTLCDWLDEHQGTVPKHGDSLFILYSNLKSTLRGTALMSRVYPSYLELLTKRGYLELLTYSVSERLAAKVLAKMENGVALNVQELSFLRYRGGAAHSKALVLAEEESSRKREAKGLVYIQQKLKEVRKLKRWPRYTGKESYSPEVGLYLYFHRVLKERRFESWTEAVLNSPEYNKYHPAVL